MIVPVSKLEAPRQARSGLSREDMAVLAYILGLQGIISLDAMRTREREVYGPGDWADARASLVKRGYLRLVGRPPVGARLTKYGRDALQRIIKR